MMFKMLEGLIYKQVEMFTISADKRIATDPKVIDSHTLMCKALREKDLYAFIDMIDEHTNYEAHMS